MDAIALPDGVLEDLRWLQRLALRLAGDRDDAEDLVQETLVEAWREPPGDASRPLRPWLATVLRNRFRMRRRGELRREAREERAELGAGEARPPDSEHERLEVLRILLEQLQRLPGDDQRIIVRRFFEGESAAEIGRALGIPSATIRSRIHRSLKQLRGSLDRRYGSRERWCAAVLAMPRGGLAPSPTTAGGTTMSITAKALLITTTMGTAGVAGWVALSPAEAPHEASQLAAPREASQTASEATPAATAEPATPRARWEGRRRSIRSTLPTAPQAEARDEPAPSPAPSLLEQQRRAASHRAFRELVRACLDDLQSEATGAVTLAVRELGAPDVGTIYESVELVDATYDDAEVLECITQSMYAYVGEAPSEPYAHDGTWTFALGDPEPGSEKDQQVLGYIVGAHMGEVRFCESKAEGAVEGSVTLTITMGETGQAEVVEAQPSPLPTAVVECIVAAAQRWQFPETMAGKRLERELVLPVPGRPPGPMEP